MEAVGSSTWINDCIWMYTAGPKNSGNVNKFCMDTAGPRNLDNINWIYVDAAGPSTTDTMTWICMAAARPKNLYEMKWLCMDTAGAVNKINEFDCMNAAAPSNSNNMMIELVRPLQLPQIW